MNDIPGVGEIEKARKGSLDSRGQIIDEIFIRRKNFIIYSSGNVLCTMGDDSQLPLKNENVIAQIHEIYSLIPEINYLYKRILAQMAVAIARGENGKESITIAVLAKILNRIIKINQIYGQLYYLFGSVFLVVLLIIINVIFFENTSTLIQKIHFISQIALFGSIGAFLSVCIGIKQLELNDFSIPWHNFIWGVVRIIIGIIGAIILFFGIKSKLIFSPFSEASSSKELIFFLCALAGFSESLVPNSLRKIEKTMDQNKTK